MKPKGLRKRRPSFWSSKGGFAVPVTLLILLASFTLITSSAYYFAIIRISSKSSGIKFSAIKLAMLSLENSISSVAWSPGSSIVTSFYDYGGKLRIEPNARSLVINLTVGSFHDIVFNSSIGKVVYEIPPVEMGGIDNFLKGDQRVVVNQGSSSMAQVYISVGAEFQEAVLSYRPLATATLTGSNNGKPVNSLRVYIINLNSSQNTALRGGFLLRTNCENITSNLRSYDFSYRITSLMVKVSIDGIQGAVSLPISSSEMGAIISVETIVCNIRLLREGV